MTDPPANPEAAPRPKGRGRFSRWTRSVLIYVVVPYCSVVAMVGAFQRKLIYFPRRVERVDVAQAPLPRGQVHAVSTVAADGQKLNGWHLLPDGRTARDEAECSQALAAGGLVALYFYGNAGSRVDDVYGCRDLTALGCHVFLFDYRGYGDNDGTPSERGLAADARAIWDYAVTTRGVPPERILLVGQSLGGAVAVRLAAEACDEGSPPAGLIVTATFTSLVDVARWHYPWLPVRWLLVDVYPSVERIGRVTCPLLFLHGTRDDIVPPEIGRRLFEAAPAASERGIAKRFVEIEGSGHNDISRGQFRRGVREFLATLPTAEPAK